MNNVGMVIIIAVVIVIWNFGRNILYSTNRDEREMLALLDAIKTTMIFTIFILGLILVVNTINGVYTVQSKHIVIVGTISFTVLIILFKLNSSTEIQFSLFGGIEKKSREKFIWILFKIIIWLDIIFGAAAIISHKYFHSKGFCALAVAIYILTFAVDYLGSKLRVYPKVI